LMSRLFMWLSEIFSQMRRMMHIGLKFKDQRFAFGTPSTIMRAYLKACRGWQNVCKSMFSDHGGISSDNELVPG
jgi:hypothetical protein